MIEISLAGKYVKNEVMKLASDVIAWLMGVLVKESEYKDIVIDGVFTVHNESDCQANILVCCDYKYHNKLMKILKQPPGEFEEKYVANICNDVSVEPAPGVKPP